MGMEDYDLESICECQYNDTQLLKIDSGGMALMCINCKKRVGADIKKQDILFIAKQNNVSNFDIFELNKQKIIFVDGLFYSLGNFDAFMYIENADKKIMPQKIMVKNGKLSTYK